MAPLVSIISLQSKGEPQREEIKQGNYFCFLSASTNAGEDSLVLNLASSVSSPPSISSSSSSSISACSAHHRPACNAKTPVKATLQIRCEDARSSVGARRDCGNGGKEGGWELAGNSGVGEVKGRGRDVKLAKKSVPLA